MAQRNVQTGKLPPIFLPSHVSKLLPFVDLVFDSPYFLKYVSKFFFFLPSSISSNDLSELHHMTS